MEIARVNVSGVACTPESASTIPRGLVGGTVSITYTDTFWNDLTKTAVFQGACTKVVPNVGDEVKVPPEVVDKAGARLKFGIYGVASDGALVIPTLWADLGKVMSSVDPTGDTSINPSLPVWPQLQALIGDLNKLSTKAKESLVSAVNEVAAKGGGGGTAADVRMDVSGGYIRYSADGGENWTNLVAMSGLVGKPGDPGDDGETPFIGENGRWWVGATDTGVQAQGEPGKNGVTPHIGENGNWYIGDTDTGVQAQGTPGNDYTLTEADKKEIAGMVEVTGGGISVSGATVGQTVKIAAVDENGVPTAWEAVDLPSGCSGGDVLWAYTVEETVAITATAFTPNIDVTALNSFSIRGKFLGASSSETGAEFFVNGNRMLKSGMNAHPIPYFVRKEGIYAEFDFLFRAVGSNKVCVFSAYNSPYRANSNDYLYSVSASDIGSIENVLESIGFVSIDKNVTMVVGAGSYIEIVGWN